MKKAILLTLIILNSLIFYSQIITNRKFPSGSYPTAIKTIDFKVIGIGAFTEMNNNSYEGNIAFKHIYELLPAYDEEGNLANQPCNCNYAGMQNNPNAGVILGTYDLSSQEYSNYYTIYKSVYKKENCLLKAESEKNLQNAKEDFNLMRIPINNPVAKINFKKINKHNSEVTISGIKFKTFYEKVSDEKPFDMMCVSKLYANGELIYQINQQDQFYMASGGKINYISAFVQNDKVFFLSKFHYSDNGGGSDIETYNFSPIFNINNFSNKTKQFENFTNTVKQGWFKYKFDFSDYISNADEYNTPIPKNIIDCVFENKDIENGFKANAITSLKTDKDFYILMMNTYNENIEMSDETGLYVIAKTGKMIVKFTVPYIEEGNALIIVNKNLEFSFIYDESGYHISNVPSIYEKKYKINDYGKISLIKKLEFYSDKLAKLLSTEDVSYINKKIIEYQNITTSANLLKFNKEAMPKFIQILKKAFKKIDPSLQDLNKPEWIRRYVKFIEIGMDGDGGDVEPYPNYEVLYKKAQTTEGDEDDVFFKKYNY